MVGRIVGDIAGKQAEVPGGVAVIGIGIGTTIPCEHLSAA
jgi:putative Mn2+ efflux pump MntP